MLDRFHDFEKAKRLGSLSGEYLKEASTIYLSRDDAEVLGVSEGDVVEVVSGNRLIRVRVRVDKGIKKGFAFMPPSPMSIALFDSSRQPLIVKVSRSTGEPTELLTILPP